MAGSLTATQVKKLDVGRDLHDAVFTLGPSPSGELTLERLMVGNKMTRVAVETTGSIGYVSTGAADQVNLFAGPAEVIFQSFKRVAIGLGLTVIFFYFFSIVEVNRSLLFGFAFLFLLYHISKELLLRRCEIL